MSNWIDISVPLQNGTVHWPGDRPFRVRAESEMKAGHEFNLSSFATSAHIGTHMDAPLHFVAGGSAMDRLRLETVIGPARVIKIAHPQQITAAEIASHQIQRGERILFKTANSDRVWHDQPFDERFIAMDAQAAGFLAERKPVLVGVDYLSVGAYEADGADTHRILLGAGIWIVEGLDLHHVEPGSYELICLPLRIIGIEGAPARAVLRRA
jgi:arylformamidase